MTPILLSLLVFVCVFGAGWLATRVRSRLPEHHLSSDTKDTVKLAMGLVATMTALILGLLVASAKSSYDTQKSAVIAAAAKLIVLDLGLAHYGPETAAARSDLREAVEDMAAKLWPKAGSEHARLDPNTLAGNRVYQAIEALTPQTDSQRELKSQVRNWSIEIGQMRWLLFAQSGSAISEPLLLVVVCWLSILFFSFGLFAPPNPTALMAILIAAISVSGAIFLILELDHPFDGLIHIPSRAMDIALEHLGK